MSISTRLVPHVNFIRRTLRELATAALLTAEFDAGEESFGTDQQTLVALAREIRAGKPPILDEHELLRHERTVEAFLQVKPIHVYWTLFRFFLPAILLIAALWGVIVLLRFVRH